MWLENVEGGRFTPLLPPRHQPVEAQRISESPALPMFTIKGTHSVAGFLTLIALLVGRCFGLVLLALLLIEGLPELTEHLSDLTCNVDMRSVG